MASLSQITSQVEADIERLKASVKNKAETLRQYSSQVIVSLSEDYVDASVAVSISTVAGELHAAVAELDQAERFLRKLWSAA